MRNVEVGWFDVCFFFHVVVVQGRYLGLEKYLFDSRDSFTFHSGFVWLWSSGILFISTKKGRKKYMKLWWKVGNRGNCISVDCRWSELRSKMSVVSGVISRQVLPACGNLCFLCPSLRTRSRQPVKRYKKLIADIFPRSQVSFLNYIYICLYACIFWSYPFYNVYFKVVS